MKKCEENPLAGRVALCCNPTRGAGMDIAFPNAGQRFGFDFSAAVGSAHKAHRASLAIPGADVFSELKLNPASVGRELPSIAEAPATSLGYTAVPNWKIWQDF